MYKERRRVSKEMLSEEGRILKEVELQETLVS